MKTEHSAGAVVFRKSGGKIFFLLLHYDLGHWDFPKGHIEKDETAIDALRREIKEETGIEKIKVIDGFKETIKYIYSWPPKSEEAERRLKFVVYFLAETKTEKIILSDEHQNYAWLKYKDALKKITYDNGKNILKKANEFIEKLKTE